MARRKIVKPVEVCPTCNQIVQPAVEQWFCDNCDKEMSTLLEKEELRTTYFYQEFEKTEGNFFHSWECFWAWLLKNRERFQATDFDFMSFPYLTAKNQKAFFKVIDSFIYSKGK